MWLRETQFRFALYRQEDGYLAIDFAIHNEAGEKVAWVKKNNISVVGAHRQTHALEGDETRVLLLEKASGSVLAEINTRPQEDRPVELAVSAKTYLPNGFLLDASSSRTNLGGGTFMDNTFLDCRIAMKIKSKGGMDLGVG